MYNDTIDFINALSGDLPVGGSNSLQGVMIWGIIALIISVACSILVYYLFVRSKDEQKGFLKKFKDFLSFKSMYIETLVKLLYYGTTIYIVLTSFSLIAMQDIFGFFLQLLFGPVIARVAYETVVILIRIWQNTNKIAGK